MLGPTARALKQAGKAGVLEPAPDIFDRTLVRRRRMRARLADADFLLAEVAERLAERLDDLTPRFPTALALGARGGVARKALQGRGGIARLIEADLDAALLAGAAEAVALDAEFLPFGEQTLDLVFASLDLHVANDLPGALLQIRRSLRPDGLFLAALFGPATLAPLRQAFLEAESALDAPAAPHVAPFVDIRDAAALLQRAGFALPVADTETITVSYGEPFRLLQDLRDMGEANVLRARNRQPLRREVLLAALARLQEIAAAPDGRLAIPFEIVFMAGWAPAASQQQPARRGSGQVSLADALKPKTE